MINCKLLLKIRLSHNHKHRLNHRLRIPIGMFSLRKSCKKTPSKKPLKKLLPTPLCHKKSDFKVVYKPHMGNRVISNLFHTRYRVSTPKWHKQASLAKWVTVNSNAMLIQTYIKWLINKPKLKMINTKFQTLKWD